MSRVEENKEVINKLGRVRFTSGDMAMLASVLTDISQSLAVIADCVLADMVIIDEFLTEEDKDGK